MESFLQKYFPNLVRVWTNLKANRLQIYAILKSLMVAGGPLAAFITHELNIDNNTLQMYVQLAAAAISIWGIVWIGTGTSQTKVLAATGQMPGVAVTVDPTQASDAAVAAAQSPDPKMQAVQLVDAIQNGT